VRQFWQRVRGAFLAGVLVVVPLVVTAYVIYFAGATLENAIKVVPAQWRPEELLGHPIPGLGVLLAITSVLIIGLVTRSYIGRRVIQTYEALLARVPVISGLYQGLKQLLESITSQEKGHFRQVVLVEWPRKGLYAIAFHTGEAWVGKEGSGQMVNLFLPTTPNPTSGFYIMTPAEDIILLNMTVEQAFKLIMSAGIVAPEELLWLAAGDAFTAAPPPKTTRVSGPDDGE
jgi:uncharacterized membrane protein